MPLITEEVLLGFQPSVSRGPGMVRRPSDLQPGELVEVEVEVTQLSWSDGQHTVRVAMDDEGVRELVGLLSGVVLPS